MTDHDNRTALPAVPRKRDLLFRGDLPDWKNNACLKTMGNGDPIAYKEGYRRGAALLAQHVATNGRDQDFLVYPIVFLYRHHIELVLKRIMTRAPYLIDASLTDQEKQHLGKHRLDLLWEDLKSKLGAICKSAGWSAPSREDIEGIDNYIRQIALVDSNSFSFRYAVSKEGLCSLPEKLTHINLRHFAEMMERLASYFEGIDEATEYLLETKAEMEAEWMSDMASYMDY
ncbi:MAG: hypothetical protein JWO20_2446 [Candidatus Angelobacter sp.]|jgi:hypothetical protein|nr:hypothetical protein [Candidatus Angelobacter sp.]